MIVNRVPYSEDTGMSPEKVGEEFADALMAGIRQELEKIDWPKQWLVELLSNYSNRTDEVWLVMARTEEEALDKIEQASGWRRKKRNYKCHAIDTSVPQRICDTSDDSTWQPVYSYISMPQS